MFLCVMVGWSLQAGQGQSRGPLHRGNFRSLSVWCESLSRWWCAVCRGDFYSETSEQHVISHCHLSLHPSPPSVSDLSGECPVSHHFVVMKWNSSADQIITFYFKILTFNGFLWVKLRIFASGQVKQNNSGFRFLIIFSFPSKLFGRKVRDKPPATPRQSFILLLRVPVPPALQSLPDNIVLLL